MASTTKITGPEYTIIVQLFVKTYSLQYLDQNLLTIYYCGAVNQVTGSTACNGWFWLDADYCQNSG